MWPDFKSNLLPFNHDVLPEVIIIMGILITVGVLNLFVKPHQRYISQDDLQLYYKYSRQPSIVPPWAMVFIVLCLPLMFFIAADHIMNSANTTHSFLAWTLALSVNAFITEVIKLITGRPRPDFFYRCYPDGKTNEALVYTGNPKDIWEGRKSFPSGHSSFAFCSMGFLSLWLCGKLEVMSRRRGRLSLTLVCLLPLVVATVVAASRFYDHHHHWEDIAFGSLLGLLVSYIFYNQYFFAINSEQAGCPPILYRRIRRRNNDDLSIFSDIVLEWKVTSRITRTS